MAKDQQVHLGVRTWGGAPQDNFDQWPPATVTIAPGQQLIVGLSDYRSVILTVDFEGAIEAYVEGPDGDQISVPTTLIQEYTL